MSTRIVNKKPRKNQYRNRNLAENLPDNVTEFPGPASRVPRRPRKTVAMPEEAFFGADNSGDTRTIEQIADHVLAARYLSAEGQDRELNRLLDLALERIGRTIAALDGADANGMSTS